MSERVCRYCGKPDPCIVVGTKVYCWDCGWGLPKKRFGAVYELDTSDKPTTW